MSQSPPLQESTYFIRQRYEDAAQVIFQQQLKKQKNDLPRRKQRSGDENGQLEIAHYGNEIVISKKEDFDSLASVSGVKNKSGKSPTRKDSSASKGKGRKEPEGFVDKYTLLHPLYNIAAVTTPVNYDDGKELTEEGLKDGSCGSEETLSQDSLLRDGADEDPEHRSEASIDRKEDKYVVEVRETVGKEAAGSGKITSSPGDTDVRRTETKPPPNLREIENRKPLNSRQTGKLSSPNSEETRTVNSPGLESSGGVVDFGHYGNTGIVANRQAVVRMASILRKDTVSVKSKVCIVM